jgi:hypothetical protein
VSGSKNNKQITRVPHRFKKGDPRPLGAGRRPGQQNRTTIAMKDAIIQAMEIAGQKKFNSKTKTYNEPGDGGLLGYMLHLALNNEQVFAPLAAKVLPMHVFAAVQNNRYKTEEEIRELCAARGIRYDVMLEAAEPAPPGMIDVTPKGD